MKRFFIIEVIIKERFGGKWKFISGEILFKSNKISECENFLRSHKSQIYLDSNMTSREYFYHEINRAEEYNLRKIKLFINRDTITKSIFNNHYELYQELNQYLRKQKLENIL